MVSPLRKLAIVSGLYKDFVLTDHKWSAMRKGEEDGRQDYKYVMKAMLIHAQPGE